MDNADNSTTYPLNGNVVKNKFAVLLMLCHSSVIEGIWSGTEAEYEAGLSKRWGGVRMNILTAQKRA